MKNNIKRVFAFTLAEVLISLTILGIVAAIVIPQVISRYNERVMVTKLKVFAARLDNAIETAKAIHGPIETWAPTFLRNCSVKSGEDEEGNPIYNVKTDGSNYSCTSVLFSDVLSQFMQTSLNCGTDRTQKCFIGNQKHKKYKDNTNWVSIDTTHNYSRFKLKDGTSVWVYVQGSFAGCKDIQMSGTLRNLCAAVGVDLNGEKGPNRMGYDTFYFWVTPKAVVPNGVNDDDAYDVDRGGCAYKAGNGYGCAAYVLKYGKMDYLRRSVSLNE